MSRSKLLLSTSLFLALAVPALGANKNFRQIDANKDGSLSRHELSSAFGVKGADWVLRRSDSNRDEEVSLAEAQASYDNNDDDYLDDGETNSGGFDQSDEDFLIVANDEGNIKNTDE